MEQKDFVYFSIRKRDKIIDFNCSRAEIGVHRLRFDSCSRASVLRSSGELKTTEVIFVELIEMYYRDRRRRLRE